MSFLDPVLYDLSSAFLFLGIFCRTPYTAIISATVLILLLTGSRCAVVRKEAACVGLAWKLDLVYR